MAADLSGIERLLMGRIGLDPVSVGPQQIKCAVQAANEGTGAGRHGCVQSLGANVGVGAASVDRGGGGLGELVFPR